MDLGASMTWIPPEPRSSVQESKISLGEALRQAWAALAVHSMVIMVGITLGFSAILLPQLEEADSDIKISGSDASWLASVVSIVAPIGSLGAGPVVQWLGSKKTIAFSMIPFAIGWLLISFANGLPMLLIGRIVTGLSSTFGNTPCIVYITEVSSPHMRPMLTTTGPTISSLGVLMVYTLGWLFSWRTAALVPAAWSLVCLAALASVPESPVWLASRGRLDEARRAVYWFYKVKPAEPTQGKVLVKISMAQSKIEVVEDVIGNNYDDDDQRRVKAEEAFGVLKKEHTKMLSHHEEDGYVKAMDVEEKLLTDEPEKEDVFHFSKDCSKKNNAGLMQHLSMLFMKPTGLKPLVILTIMFLLQQYAGVYITLFYAVNVFKEMGGGAMNEYVASIMVGLVRFTMSLVNIWLFRKFGRRPLCLLSTVGMAVCMLTSGTSLYLTSIDEEVLLNNMVNFNSSHDHFNWSTQDITLPTSQLLAETASDGAHNLSLSANDKEVLQLHRHLRSLNETLSKNLAVNSSTSGNSSNHDLVDSFFGYSNLTEAGQMGLLPLPLKNASSKVEDQSEHNSNLDQRNTSYGVTIPGVSTSTITPHASGSVKKSSVIPFICMLLYVCVSMVGLLAIPWTMTAELFPTEIRGLANSVVLSLAHLLLFSGLQVYPSMLGALGPHGVLWMFASVSAVSSIFVYFFLPETYGKNLDEIETYFAKNTVYTYPCKKE